MKGTTAVLALCAALLPAVAVAGSKRLSNTDLEDFRISILPNAEPSPGHAEPPAATPAAADSAAFPGPAIIGSSAEQTAAPARPTARRPTADTATASRALSASKKATGEESPAGDRAADAESPKLVLHLKAATDIIIRSTIRSAREDVRFDPQTGIIELRIGENVISIDAPGTQGISFER